MKPIRFRFFMLACGGLAALGLSVAEAQRAPAGGPAPCSLLSSAQVTAAVGVTVGAAQPIADTGCSWSGPHMIVTLSLWDGSDPAWGKLKTPFPGMSKGSVSGLGDDAIMTTMGPASGKQFVTLSVKKGATAYLFKVYGPTAAEQISMEKALAGNVLAKL
ncbi:MAG TPA: hypothetical protein VHW95_07695 [Steroidobacteraceae bacterium]|jgi:hypothetical protein|nr:hypothetical protein [Steroidobacteraceae bacterium]